MMHAALEATLVSPTPYTSNSELDDLPTASLQSDFVPPITVGMYAVKPVAGFLLSFSRSLLSLACLALVHNTTGPLFSCLALACCVTADDQKGSPDWNHGQHGPLVYVPPLSVLKVVLVRWLLAG
jgi:hypothetical protein